MILSSILFTQPTNEKLKNCAKSDPDHIMMGVNDQGDHVGRIQTALIRIRNDNPGLGLPPIAVEDLGNTKYGNSTAACVLKYKQMRGIVNRRYQNTADNIVGIGTMAALDKDLVRLQSRFSVPELPIPPIDPTPAPPPASVRRIISRSFVQVEGESFVGGGDDESKNLPGLIFGLDKDVAEAQMVRFEIPGTRTISLFPQNFRVNRLIKHVTIEFEVIVGGSKTTTSTNMDYEWGQPLPNVRIEETLVVIQKTFEDLNRPPVRKFSSLPRTTAENTAFVIPPTP